MILDFLQNRKIDAQKYKALVAKAYKDESGTVKACAEEDIRKLQDPKNDQKVEAWFREMIENTGVPFQNQQKLYQYYKAQQAPPASEPKITPPAKPVPKTTEVQKPDPSPKKIEQPPQVHQSPGIE